MEGEREGSKDGRREGEGDFFNRFPVILGLGRSSPL